MPQRLSAPRKGQAGEAVTVVEDGTRSEVEITRPVISIGRAIDNDVRLTSALVSRHHCRIEMGPEGSWVIDLGSANGTSVNGNKVTRRLLEAGDRVHVGAAPVPLGRPPGDAEPPPRHTPPPP